MTPSTTSGSRAAILCGIRTPFTRAGGALAGNHALELIQATFAEVLARSGVDPGLLDEVILGCAGQPAEAQNLARVAALRAGVPDRVPALTVHRNCASGVEALTQAVLRLRAHQGELYLVGGVEAMSQAPLLFPEAMGRWLTRLSRAKGLLRRLSVLAGFRPRLLKPRIGLLEGLTDPVSGLIMGETAEVLAREFEIPREEQDQFALESHRRAAKARTGGDFHSEIMPVLALPGFARLVEADDGIREDLDLARLARLRPYFDPRHGTVTVGNSCQITDGAGALLVGSESMAERLGIAPLGYLCEFAYAGLDPRRMGLGPVFATSRLLERSAVRLEDFEQIEVNEAFAAQVLACDRAFASDEFARRHLGRTRALGAIDPARRNPRGGAIALGHPVGATGLRLVLTLLHGLRRAGARHGLATLCVGGGQGAALHLEAAA